MKKSTWVLIIGIVTAIMTVYLIITLVFHKGFSRPDVSEFSPYISGYTSGVISKSASIKVQLSNDFAKDLPPINERSLDLFKFDSDLKGKTGWIDFRTVQFVPDNPLESDKSYEIGFNLQKLDSDIERAYRLFEYKIKTKPQSFNINVTEIKTIDKQKLEWQQVHGEIRTADTEEIENIQKIIKSNYVGQELPVLIKQKTANLFQFKIDSVPRKKLSSVLIISYNGNYINSDKKGEVKIKIPSISDFVLIEAKVIQHPEQYIKLQFSDPIMENQYLDGLIQLSDGGVLNYSVQNNIIRVYPGERLEGEHTLTVNPGIKNILSCRYKDEITKILTFEQILPAVRMTGKGVIMPKAEGNLLLPFEAVNLRAVDVRITKIFENNVMQFLQVNDMSEDYELRRVGKVIKTKTIFLDQTNVANLGQWNRYTLDLNELISTNPGAIYRVDICFRQKYAIYPCKDSFDDKENLTSTTSSREEKEFWDNYEDYYYGGWYDWENRNNPCHEAYFGFRRAESRNVFASNMGLIAKEGNDGSILVVVTDLMTAAPIKDIHVDLYNYQQQLIISKQTDKDGVVEFSPLENNEKASYVIASQSVDKAYLKINDGNSLSISDFDVEGVDVSEGFKGFIYGERGVWRPGDSIFIGFIFEDIRHDLPLGHPVIFELYNSRSQIIDKQVQNLNQWNFHVFRTKTDSDAPTGNYSARITVGGKTFYKSISIETIKPNRLKIDLQMQDDALFVGKSNPINLWVNWLHGAVAKNLRTTVSLSLYPTTTSFDKFESYHFDDNTRNFEHNTNIILDEKTDANGHIQKDLLLENVENAPGKLIARLTTKAFEESGNFSIKEQQLFVHPYVSYVGMKLPESSRTYSNYLSTDKEHIVNIATVTPKGELISDEHNLLVELVKSDWSWWYYSYDYTSNYSQSEYLDLISRDTLSTNKGKASWDFKIDHDNWGYYILKVTDLKSGHSCSQQIYADWSEYASVGRNQAKSASILQFKSDKETYQVNESVTLTLPGSESGRAFICIENGSKVLDHYWMETEKGETQFTFNLSEEMSPNIYVHISLIQAHEQTENDRPIRMYGVIPINVENKATHLEPVLKMADELRAESEISIEVREHNKKDMTYTIAIVDEGLLSLTNYLTPDPWKYFYAREALGVKTWDMYDWVIGAYSSKLEHLLSIGGGGILDSESAKNANRFTPMVKFIGPFHLNGGKKAIHKIKLPKYIGSVRTMIIASNNDGAYGSSEKSTPVIKPLMVLGTLPRVLGPKEEVILPVTIFAMKDNIRSVDVKIVTNEFFEPVGEKSQTVVFDRNGDKTINFKLKTIEKTGIAKVEIRAACGTEISSYPIELDVRNPNPPMIDAAGTGLSPKKTWNYSFDEFGISGTGKTTLEFYSIPPINLQKRLKYLITYPHGCVEQTVSAAFPQLFLKQFTSLTPKQEKNIENNVNSALNKLRKFQMSNGGFSYWAGGRNTSQWGTNYAGHFILEAKKQGYHVPEALLSSWEKYQKTKAMKWTDDGNRSQFIQAYRLYTLALSGSPKLSAMNRLRQVKNLSEDARWRLAAAYEMSGKHMIALDLTKQLSPKVSPYIELSNTFGSSVRDEAMILESFVLMDNQESAFEVLRNMATELGKDQWMSTQTTAYALISIGEYITRYGVSDNLSATYSLNGKEAVSVTTDKAVLQIPLDNIESKNNVIDVNNKSDAMIFTRIVREGVPSPGSENASASKLGISVSFMTLDGKIINPAVIEQGSDFVCEVRVFHNSFEYKLDEIALTQIFPSGWEIVNSRMFSTQLGENSVSNYQDIRDDRIYTYFDIMKGKSKTFRVMLNASYAGKFYMPAMNAEAMYNNSIHARNKGRWVEVVQPD